MKKVILTTGGTGGHIYPGLAIAKELQNKGVEVLWVGTNIRMEKDIIPKADIRFVGLDINSPRTVKSIFKYILGILKAIKLVIKEKPDAIIGFGNYISVPCLIAGILLGKKVYLQEQNVCIGGTNRAFYRFSEKIFLAFEKTYDDVPIKFQHKCVVTGNPLRQEIYSINLAKERANMKIENDEKVLVVIGGSLGAQEINNEIVNRWNEIYENKNLRLYWSTGKNNYDMVMDNVRKTKINDSIKPYFENMINILSVADFVVCRAGALTISELIQLEKPSILIPYSSKEVGQYENAKILEEIGAAIIYNNKELDIAINRALEIIENNEELGKMKSNIKKLKNDNATEQIVKLIDIWRN